MNYVAGGVTYLDAIAHAIRLANEDIDPGDETFHRRLHSQSNNDRSNTECGDGGIPIDKNYRYSNQRDYQCNDQVHDALKRETSGSILDTSEPIHGSSLCNRQHKRD